MKHWRWLAVLVAVLACSKRTEQTAEAPAASTMKSAPIATVAAKPPLPPTRRMFPKTVAASSEVTKLSDPHPAWNAFDGRTDSAWSESAKGPGKGEWLEATFSSPRHVRVLRVIPGYEATSDAYGDLFFANAHAKSLRITGDGGKEIAQRGVAEGERLVTFDNLDVDVTTVRVTIEDVWPGRKWEDLAVSEIEVIADDDGRASGFEAPPSLEETLPKLAKIEGVSKQPYDFLLTLGFPEPMLHEQQWSKVRTARVVHMNLDADDEPEGVVEISLVPPQEAPPRPYVRFFYAIVDDGKRGSGVIGRRDFYALSCGDAFQAPGLASDAPDVDAGPVEVAPNDPSPSEIARLRFDRVHDARFDDVVIEWTTPLLCDDLGMGRRFAMVLTVERGTAEELLHFEDTFRKDAGGKTVDPVRLLQLVGAAPQKGEIHEAGKPKRTLAFDPATFRYR